MFTLIACINNKGALGKDGNLLYHIKNDLANFKSMTMNSVIVMGRKTFESLPNKKPLEGRINIIITSDKDFHVEENSDVYIVDSVEGAVELCEAFFDNKELFVIGGGQTYKAFLDKDLVNEARLTVVDDDADGDTFLPTLDYKELVLWDKYYESLPQTEGDKTFKYIILKKR